MIEVLKAWVTSSQQNPVLGILPKGSYILRAHCHVTVAFNGSGTDEITIGYDSDSDAVATAIDVSTTGIKSLTLGAINGYNGTARSLEAYYVNDAGEPSLGKAFIVVEYIRTPISP